MNPCVSVIPLAMNDSFERSLDHSSPASSNGLPYQESESRSRASLVSSHSHYPSSIHGIEHRKTRVVHGARWRVIDTGTCALLGSLLVRYVPGCARDFPAAGGQRKDVGIEEGVRYGEHLGHA